MGVKNGFMKTKEVKEWTGFT